MKKITFLLLFALLPIAVSAYNLKRVSVHDPSIVWDSLSRTYYIFGTHRGAAKTKDLMSWTSFNAPWKTSTSNNAASSAAFRTNQTKTVTIKGEEVAFGNFDVHAWSAAYGNYNIDGNLWAPDVIYNKKMKKWCMYMSVNGPTWNSSIVLLTADKIEGPYTYQGPVIFSGFFNTDNATITYKNTDLELVLGTLKSLPSRYNHGNNAGWGESWGDYMPHCIDPCVFYDEEGQLWMSYGSWSGGIWILKLNEENGLRDYDATYPLTGSGKNISVDPYFGKKIAGGYYVSGEGSYIEYVNGYYFLFVTNGGLSAAEGYQMRMFRSEKPDGPYVDAKGTKAIYTSYKMNYGPNSDTRGVNVFGPYGEWGYMAKGNLSERAQGHNSIIAAEDGRTYLVYHTRFQDWGEAHQVRVHQVFQNKNKWLVVAPFEYTGEQVKSADIDSTQQIASEKIPGSYKVLIHRYGLKHTDKALGTPVEIRLNEDGTVTGAYSGTWSIIEGTSYFNITMGGILYEGVMIEQTMEPTNEKCVAFTALSKAGITVWGHQFEEVSAEGDFLSDVKAYYSFDETPIVNQYNEYQRATLHKEGSNSVPTLQTDGARKGKVLHTNFGANGNTSHAKFINPLYKDALENGATIAFWVKVPDENLWDALFAFYNTQNGSRLYMTGNTYVGYNSMTNNNNSITWIDLNHPNGFSSGNINFGSWNFITLTISATDGIKLYVDGNYRPFQRCSGSVNSNAISGESGFDYNYIINHIRNCSNFYLGYGSFWGSTNASYDELLFYNRVLAENEVKALYQAETVNDFTTTGILEIEQDKQSVDNKIYDLQGRPVANPTSKGMYIKNGSKYIVK